MLKSIFQSMAARRHAPAEPKTAESGFFDHLMGRFYASLGTYQQDNIDRERFGLLAGADVRFNPTAGHLGFQQVREHVRQLERVHGLFEDATSRSLYEDLLLYRMLGPCYIRLPTNNERHWAMREAARSLRSGPSDLGGADARLERFELEFCGHRMNVQCWSANIAYSFLIRQYYFDRDGVTIQPAAGDYVIDAGACFGETALGFAAAAQSTGRVFAFDIMPAHIEVTRANLLANPALAARIEVCEAALSDHDDQPLYIHGDGPGAHVSGTPSSRPVKVTTIDKFVAARGIPHIDFIKMDIEGAESPALRGAVETLRRWRPKLAISMYHRPTDIFSLPLFIDSLDLDYAYYLDHYTIHAEETVLYATPR